MEDKNLRLIELATRIDEMNQMEWNNDKWFIRFKDGKIIIYSELKNMNIFELDLSNEYKEYEYNIKYSSHLEEYNGGTMRLGWILGFINTKGEDMGIDEYFNHLLDNNPNKLRYIKYLRGKNELNWG